jgi:hypothetical protein
LDEVASIAAFASSPVVPIERGIAHNPTATTRERSNESRCLVLRNAQSVINGTILKFLK